MFNVWVQWLVYGLSALACFWAWEKLFFWVKQKDLKIIVRILGAALLFTPAPLDPEGTHYAPAFIVIIFRTFLETDTSIFDAVIYMLVTLCVGLVLMSLLSLITFVRAKVIAANK
mgnify:CR=1 FL=1